jgi:hypothetical protein
MAHLGDTPLIQTVNPFATPPTLIETNLSETRKAVFTGIGMAIGLSVGGAALYVLKEMLLGDNK